jgi:hypothetical protein
LPTRSCSIAIDRIRSYFFEFEFWNLEFSKIFEFCA